MDAVKSIWKLLKGIVSLFTVNADSAAIIAHQFVDAGVQQSKKGRAYVKANNVADMAFASLREEEGQAPVAKVETSK